MTDARTVIAIEIAEDDGSWSNGIPAALVKADAILSALNAAGYKVVGREPTEAMVDATEGVGPEVEDTWRAMFDAVPPVTKGEK